MKITDSCAGGKHKGEAASCCQASCISTNTAVYVSAEKGTASTKPAYEAIPITQFGSIVNLPDRFSGKNSSVNLSLNPNAGGLAEASTGKGVLVVLALHVLLLPFPVHSEGRVGKK